MLIWLFWLLGMGSFGAHAAPDLQKDWTFTPAYAFRLPVGWKVLSQSDIPGIGHELLAGRSVDDYTRLFVSGDAFPLKDFRSKMSEVIKNASQEHAGALVETPRLVPFREGGLQMRLVFQTTIKSKKVTEAHLPFVIRNQGMDIHAVAPRERQEALLKELEAFMSSVRVYWAEPGHAKPR